MDWSDLYSLRTYCRLSRAAAAQRLALKPRTLQRYESENRCPEPVRLALQLLAGDLGKICKHWDGWRLQPTTGELIAPNGDAWNVGALNARHWDKQLIQSLRGELRRYREQEQEKPPETPGNVIRADFSHRR